MARKLMIVSPLFWRFLPSHPISATPKVAAVVDVVVAGAAVVGMGEAGAAVVG